MIRQYCFSDDSPEWSDPAKGSSDKLKTRVIMVTMLKHRRRDKHTHSEYLYSKCD